MTGEQRKYGRVRGRGIAVRDRGGGPTARPHEHQRYAPTMVIVRRTSAVVAVFAVTVTR